jgi:hypothetical protein
VFYEVGITKDGKSVLMDPQSANSYSYARDNPIQNKDTLGRFFEFFASAAVPGRSWSIGLRADSNGFGYFLSGGVGVGVHGGLGLMWAPGQDLSQERSTGIVASVTGAEGLGGRLWQNLSTYSPEQRENVANGGPGFGVVLGAGYSATLELEGYSPLWVWRKQSKPSQLGSTAGIPSTIGAYRGASGSISPRNTSGGAGSSINVPGGSLWIVNGNLYDFGDHKSTPPILLGPAQVKNK